jgi:hypothetical protein
VLVGKSHDKMMGRGVKPGQFVTSLSTRPGTQASSPRCSAARWLGTRSPRGASRSGKPPYRAMDDADLGGALVKRIEELSEVSDTATRELGPDTDVGWTGRTMKVSCFAEHMREELILHRWDLTGDDAIAPVALSEPWLTRHSVLAVGRPLLARGASGLKLGDSGRVEGRLRVEGTDDVVIVASAGGTSISLAEPKDRRRSRLTPLPAVCCSGAGDPVIHRGGLAAPDRRRSASFGPCSVATDRLRRRARARPLIGPPNPEE